MNSSAKTYEPIYGFDISFLPRVKFIFNLKYIYIIFHSNSYIQQKQTMVNVHYYILCYKKSKKTIQIY